MMDKCDADAIFYGPRRESFPAIGAGLASAQFPEAMVLFDQQCTHLHDCPDLVFRINRSGYLVADSPSDRAQRRIRFTKDHTGFMDSRDTMRTVWHPKAMVWVRSSRDVRTRTTRKEFMREVLLKLGPGEPLQLDFGSATWTEV